MTAKEYLNQIRKLDTQIRRYDENIQMIRTELVTLREQWPDGQPHSKSGTSDPVGEQATKLADTLTELETKQLKTRAKLWRTRMEIIDRIGQLSDGVLVSVLFSRYVDCKAWEQIAVDMGYSYRHIVRLHGEALEKFKAVVQTCP